MAKTVIPRQRLLGGGADPELHLQVVDETPYPPMFRGWWVVGMFFLASVVSTLDRGVFGFVVDPVRHDLHISEVQIGLLQGFSFGLFYAMVGLPLGLFADRLSRKWLILTGITVWSLGTVVGGYAHSFTMMFATRLVVGLGEATLGPCAVSMISDMFPPHRRGRAISVYLMGQAASGGLSVMLTSFILSAAPQGRFAAIGLGGVAPWRVVFIISGALGFIASAMMLTVREPLRRGVVIQTGRGFGLRETLAYLIENGRLFVPFYLAVAFCALGVYGMGAWNATFLLRQYHLRAQDVGSWMGPITLVAGLTGPLIAGVVVDRIGSSGSRSGKFVLLIVLPLLLIPAGLGVLAPNVVSAVLLGALVSFFFPMFGTTFVTTVQEIVPNNMRGFAVSLFGLFNTIIGATFGPLLIAAATERVFRNPTMIGRSIALVMTPALVLSSLISVFAYVGFKRMIARPGEVRAVLQEEGATAA